MASTLSALRRRLDRALERLLDTEPIARVVPLRTYRKLVLDDAFTKQVVTRLTRKHPRYARDVQIVDENRPPPLPQSEAEAAALGWAVLEHVVEQPVTVERLLWVATRFLVSEVERSYVSGELVDVGSFFRLYLQPLHDYLVHALEDHTQVLSAFVRFQQWAAWFGNPSIRAVIAEELKRVENGEKTKREFERRLQQLAFERLFTDGLRLNAREPLSGVGMPDFVFDVDGEYVVCEAKLFDPARNGYGKRNLRAGTEQLLNYMDQYNAGSGYLVVFDFHPVGLRCRLDESVEGVPFVRAAGNRTVYVIVAPSVERGPASKVSKRPQRPVELLKRDLVSG